MVKSSTPSAAAEYCSKFTADSPGCKSKISLFNDYSHLNAEQAENLLALTDRNEAAEIIQSAFLLEEAVNDFFPDEGICDCCFTKRDAMNIKRNTKNESISGMQDIKSTSPNDQQQLDHSIDISERQSNVFGAKSKQTLQMSVNDTDFSSCVQNLMKNSSDEAREMRCCCGVCEKRRIYGLTCLLQLFLCGWEYAKSSQFKAIELSCTLSILRFLLPEIVDSRMTHVHAKEILDDKLLKHSIFRPPLFTNVFTVRTLHLVEAFFVEYVIFNLNSLKFLFCPPKEIHVQPQIVKQNYYSALMQENDENNKKNTDEE